MGFAVGYDTNTKAIRLDNKIDDITVNVSGIDNSVKTINIGGYNYVNIRDIAKTLGRNIDYKNGKVVIE